MMVTLEDLIAADVVPAPFTPGEELWNDPYIAKMMLKAHLSADNDLASYMPEKRQAICDYLAQTLPLQAGDAVVDLGCGPGLYCTLLRQKGFCLTGIDRSENSLLYARKHDPHTNYVVASYLDPFGTGQFDAALMISQDYGVLSGEDRQKLLAHIHAALKPGGYFAFDVSSLAAFQQRRDNAVSHWYAADAGFWRPHRHFVLEKTVFYPELFALCDLVTVFDAAGVKAYRIYQSFFSPESIDAELSANGFQVTALLANLYGESYDEATSTLGVICQKV